VAVAARARRRPGSPDGVVAIGRLQRYAVEHTFDAGAADALFTRRPRVGRKVACVGGGSNAIGLFWAFIRDRRVRIVGVEPGGHGIKTGLHGASLGSGAVGVLHGSMSYVLQNDDGQVAEAHSISAGLDYPGVGPEHSYYKDAGRFEYVSVTDKEALEGFQALTRLEGIMPALESSHAVAYAMRAAARMKKTQIVVIGLSGRGDKDVHTVGQALGGQGANGHGRS